MHCPRTSSPRVPSLNVLGTPAPFPIQAQVAMCGIQRDKTTESIKLNGPLHTPVWSRLKSVIGYVFPS